MGWNVSHLARLGRHEMVIDVVVGVLVVLAIVWFIRHL